jgi:type II secretory pathway component PulK
MRPVGTRFDVNAIDEASLSRVLMMVGMTGAQAESAAAAVLDWEDGDDRRRPMGAEREWYEARGRIPPFNRPLTDLRELHLVRGLETTRGVEGLLDVEPGPVALDQADPAVLRLLPGFTTEAAQRVADARAQGTPFESFLDLSRALSPPARDALEQATAQLGGSVTFRPSAWILTVTSSSGKPPVTVVLEVRLGRGTTGLLVARRRSWIP